jgi:hypothetical protein
MSGIEAKVTLDSRFQRSFRENNLSWGVAPGLDEPVPLALNTYAVGDPGPVLRFGDPMRRQGRQKNYFNGRATKIPLSVR